MLIKRTFRSWASDETITEAVCLFFSFTEYQLSYCTLQIEGGGVDIGGTIILLSPNKEHSAVLCI